MGAVLQGKTERYRVCMIGQMGAGKTTILYRLADKIVISSLPTVMAEFKNVYYKKVEFFMAECRTNWCLTPLVLSQLNEYDALIFVVSGSVGRNMQYFDEIYKLFWSVITHANWNTKRPILFYVNMLDLIFISRENIIQLFKLHLVKNHWKVVLTCAISQFNNGGLDEGLQFLYQELTTIQKQKLSNLDQKESAEDSKRSSSAIKQSHQ